MRKLSTSLVVIGLLSFLIMMVISPMLLVCYTVSFFSIVSVLFFLIVQLRPEEKGGSSKRKWIISSIILAIIGHVLFFCPFLEYIAFEYDWLEYFWLALFPFSLILMSCNLPSVTSILLFVCVLILDIGLFALYGLTLGTIVRKLTRLFRAHQSK